MGLSCPLVCLRLVVGFAEARAWQIRVVVTCVYCFAVYYAGQLPAAIYHLEVDDAGYEGFVVA